MTGVSRVRLFAAFSALGGTAAVIPALLPALAMHYGVSLDEVLIAVPALFAGLVLGILGAGALSRRLGGPRSLSLASGVQAIGLIAIGLSGEPLAFVIGAAVCGAGFGLGEVVATACARQASNGSSPRLLAQLMAALAAAAMLAPLMVLVTAQTSWPAAAALTIAVLHLSSVRWPRGALSIESVPRTGSARPSRVLVSLAIAVFFYVGAETVLSGWSAAAVSAATGASPGVAALGTSAFWFLMTAGRLAGARVIDRTASAATVLAACATVMLLSLTAAAALAPFGGVLILGLLAVAVVAAAPCYAVLLGLAVDSVEARQAAPAASAIIAVGAVGGAVIPAVAASAGLASSSTVAAGAAAGVLAMTLVAGAVRRQTTAPEEALR